MGRRQQLWGDKPGKCHKRCVLVEAPVPLPEGFGDLSGKSALPPRALSLASLL